MANSIVELLFHADTKELDEAKEKLQELGKETPTVGEMIEKLADSFGKIPGPVGLAVAGMAAFGFGLEHMIEGTVEAQTALLELSEAVGIPVEKLQAFNEAMELSGVSSQKLQQTIGKFSQTIEQALTQPAGKAADEFKKLGISQQELKEGDVEQIMKDAAKGFDAYADSASKTAAIRDLFGRQGPQIVAALQQEAQFEAMAKQAQDDYGTAISESDAKASKYFGETLKLGMTMFQGVATSVTKSLLPGLQELVNQFADSGKQGGIMRDILNGLSATITVVAKALITGLVEPIRAVAEVFKATGMTIGATFAAINEAAHGNFGAARQVFKDLDGDIQKLDKDNAAAMESFESKLWSGAQAVQGTGAAADEAKPRFEAFNATAKKIADTLEQLKAKFVAQTQEFVAASQGLAQYKQIQDQVAISAELMRLKQEGASKAALATAESYLRGTAAAKTGTEEQVAGWTELATLTEQYNSLITKQSALSQANAAIQKNNLDTLNAGEAQQIRNEAQLVDQAKEAAEVAKIVNQFEGQTATLKLKTLDAMKLTTTELQRQEAEQKLTQQFNTDVLNKTPDEVAKITAAYNQTVQTMKDLNTQEDTFKTSSQGAFAGASKAVNQFNEDATNLNNIGLQGTNTLLNGMADAFTKVGTEGKAAFQQLLVSMLQYFEQLLIKMAMAKAMQATGLFANGGAFISGANVPVAGASGYAVTGSINAFADGGVVNSPTLFPMSGGRTGLMGEAGPEAVMPLTRDGTGRLGVKSLGQANTSNGEVHYHAPQVNVYSNQDPHDIAKQVKKQVGLAGNIAQKKIAEAQRPNGALAKQSHAF